MRIGFIGAGKVGYSLGKYLTVSGININGYFSKSIESAKEAAYLTDSRAYNSIEGIISDCDTLFLTVPDNTIQPIWQTIKKHPIHGKNICHCSGSLSSLIFDNIEHYGAYGYSVHPMLAVHDKIKSFEYFKEVCFTIEGSSKNINIIANIFESLGNKVSKIKPEYKTLYHVGCVVVSNLIQGLVTIGEELFKKCGLDSEFAESAWHSLFLGNANNICQSGIIESLTGPVERADALTIRNHLDCLDGSVKDIYIRLSEVLITVAKEKHPERDFSEVKKELKNEKYSPNL